MKKSIVEIINMFFGSSSKQKFKRLIVLLALIGFFAVLLQNIQCGIDSKGEWYFNWSKAADIEIKKEM